MTTQTVTFDSDESVLIPKSALAWLFGEAGEFECPPERYFRGKAPPYWWRGVLRDMIESAPSPPCEVGDGRDGLDDLPIEALRDVVRSHRALIDRLENRFEPVGFVTQGDAKELIEHSAPVKVVANRTDDAVVALYAELDHGNTATPYPSPEESINAGRWGKLEELLEESAEFLTIGWAKDSDGRYRAITAHDRSSLNRLIDTLPEKSS